MSNQAAMASTDNAQLNGTKGKESQLGSNFTDAVINAVGPKANPRLAHVLNDLTRHLHQWMRENGITLEEYMAGIDLINRAGQMSDDKRNEGLLLFDIFGLESVADENSNRLATGANGTPTTTAILGPFWQKDAPKYNMGDSIASGFAEGNHTLISGTVIDFDTGKPVENAELDIWQSGPDGVYSGQDADHANMNLRGRFYTGPDGKYDFYCLRPTKYSIPYDGPAGEVLQLLDRHPWRPAHIHFIISAPGYKQMVTQIFDRTDEHIDNDVAFAVVDSLIVDFEPRKGDPKAQFEFKFNFKLVSYESAKKYGMGDVTGNME